MKRADFGPAEGTLSRRFLTPSEYAAVHDRRV